jgi:acetyl esterase/lipase
VKKNEHGEAAMNKIQTSLSSLCVLFASVFISSFACAQTTEPAAPRIKLWDSAPGIVAGKDTDTDPTEPTMDIYLPQSQAPTAAVVVLPGGGYVHLATVKEGSSIAQMLNSHQIAAFVVRYRHAPRYQYPTPVLDAQRALRTVRFHAAEYNIDPRRVGVMGFSAGGHLAATLATQFDSGDLESADPIDHQNSRPDFAVLVYPVITLTQEEYVHKGSRQALLGDRHDLWPTLSPDLRVSPRTPPTFLVHATTDRTVPVENSVFFYLACRKNHVPAELHLFQNGPHGFGLAPTDPALRVWPDLMIAWMRRNKWISNN